MKVYMVLFVVLLTSCVYDQHIYLNYFPESKRNIGDGKAIALSVLDERSYISSGNKDKSYIGHYRGGYGNTWDVRTEGEVALSECFADDLKEELSYLGYRLDSSANRRLLVSINDFNFDAMLNGKFWYDIEIKVLDKNVQITRTVLKRKEIIEGDFWLGAKEDMEYAIPLYYGQIIQSIVRNNKDIKMALSK